MATRVLLTFLVFVLVIKTLNAQSICADLSWETEAPYPFIPNAIVTTRMLQVGCFSYQKSAVITYSGGLIPWFNDTLDVSDTNRIQWAASMVDVNPDHDFVSSQTRLFWDLTRTTLTIEFNYQRMLWEQGEDDLLSNVVKHQLTAYSVENKENVKEIDVTIQSVTSLDEPTKTTALSQTQLRKRIPSATSQDFIPLTPDQHAPDLHRLVIDKQHALETFQKLVNRAF